MEQHKPTVDDKALTLNQALIDGLKHEGHIRSPRVEAAFRAVRRHLFLPDVPLEEVYTDQALPAKQDEAGEWLSSSSQPTIMAIMLEQLDLQPGHKVLEIGTGTGYNAALMAHIVGEAGHVVTVDIEEDLAASAEEHLAAAGLDRVQAVCTDGGYGYADGAPYDRIILTVGAPDIAPAWWDQIRTGGRLVLPLAIKGSQKSIAFQRRDDHLSSLSVRDCGFITLRGAFAVPSVRRVSLGPDPGLAVAMVEERPLNADEVYRWLTGGSKDWDTNVKVALHEIISGLEMWLALHDPASGTLEATGDAIEHDVVPPLIGLGGKCQTTFTFALFEEYGLAALMRPPGQRAPLIDIDALFALSAPFALFVRQFGPDESPAQRLIAQVRAWDAAGRPSSDRLRVRVYRKDQDYAPTMDEILVEKQWTHLVLDWPATVS